MTGARLAFPAERDPHRGGGSAPQARLRFVPNLCPARATIPLEPRRGRAGPRGGRPVRDGNAAAREVHRRFAARARAPGRPDLYAHKLPFDTLEFIRSRRDADEPPGEEVASFEEYAYLYRDSCSDPAIRWLLSTVPSAMVFDDHEVSDDWNIFEA
ncbi:MAG: alkaline phosphatase D family protein [Actinomycetota bacterium]|nr:alkaline phosphatase D family protein [Actinomycetota bacterium]